MSDVLLLHGAASTGWLWHRVQAELARAGHRSVAPDLPCADPSADLHDYVAVARKAARTAFDGAPFTLVAQSMAGLVAPVVAERDPVERVVLVAPMIPRPGETGFEWWEATGQARAQREYLDSLGFEGCDPLDPEIVFVHDAGDALRAESARHVPEQQPGPLATPAPFTRWPDVPTHVVAATEDRLFPLDFVRRQARERLGIEADTIPGGHLAVLTQAPRLVELLRRYEAESAGSGAPSTAGSGAPSTAGSGAPSTAGSGAPSTARATAPSGTGARP